MKSVLLICLLVLVSVSVCSQDFASRFLTEHPTDTNLSCVTISPKMMGEIMRNDAEKDSEVLKIISNLKSMQMLTSKVNGDNYFDEAMKIVEKNQGRFEPFLSFKDKSQTYQIMVRKKNDAIVELVMLMNEGDRFSVINFTGNMSSEFISKLAASMKQKRSE